jgi:3-deoxy-D-manno-octulosonic acid (KDO) 8-phosphate synthase
MGNVILGEKGAFFGVSNLVNIMRFIVQLAGEVPD